MSSSLSNLFAAAAEQHNQLPMPPVAYGVLSLVAFGVLLGILWFFRGTAQKYAKGHAHGQAGEHH
jgi:hypothetical protein